MLEERVPRATSWMRILWKAVASGGTCREGDCLVLLISRLVNPPLGGNLLTRKCQEYNTSVIFFGASGIYPRYVHWKFWFQMCQPWSRKACRWARSSGRSWTLSVLHRKFPSPNGKFYGKWWSTSGWDSVFPVFFRALDLVGKMMIIWKKTVDFGQLFQLPKAYSWQLQLQLSGEKKNVENVTAGTKRIFRYYQWPCNRNLNWRYLPYIRPMFQAYVREYHHKNMALYGTVPPI